MAKKALQILSDQQLQEYQKLSTEQIVNFLENFRDIHSKKPNVVKTKLISIKIPSDLLETFRSKSAIQNIKYQTKIKDLMKEWIQN